MGIFEITKQLASLFNLVLNDTNHFIPRLDSYNIYYSKPFTPENFKNMPPQSKEMRVLLQIIDACFIVSMNDEMERYGNNRIILRYSVGQLIPLLELYEKHLPASPEKNIFKRDRERFMQNWTKFKEQNSNSVDIVTRFMDSSVEILMDYRKIGKV